ETAIRHFENADLVRRPEPVLHRSEDAELVAAVAFEIEDGIDHMLDDLGAGDLAVLGDMADEKDCRSLLLGEADEGFRTRLQLRDGSGCRIDDRRPDGLDR